LMIGNTIIDPADPKVNIYLRLSYNEVGPRTPGLQNILIPETSMFQSLKIRISSSNNAPDQVIFFTRVIVRSIGGTGELSEVQQREIQEIMKWDNVNANPSLQLANPAPSRPAPAL